MEGLKAFEGILQGQDAVVHTEFLNLLYQVMPTQQMVCWRLRLEEFHPIVKRKTSDAADALSRLGISDNDGFDEME